MHSTLIPITLLITLLLAPLNAQGEQVSKEGRFTFSCLSFEKSSFDELFYLDGREYVPLELRPRRRSQEYTLRASKAFGLFTKVKNEEGKRVFKLVGKCDLPAGQQKLLLLLEFRDTEKVDELPVVIQALSDSLAEFPPGSFRFANFTGKNLYVDIAGGVQKLVRNQLTTIPVETSQEGGFVPVTFGDAKGKKLFFTRMYLHGRSRELVFIKASGNLQRPLSLTFVPQNIR